MKISRVWVIVGGMAPDTNSFTVNSILHDVPYKLDRTGATYYEDLRTGQFLTVWVCGDNVFSVEYPGHDELVDKLRG